MHDSFDLSRIGQLGKDAVESPSRLGDMATWLKESTEGKVELMEPIAEAEGSRVIPRSSENAKRSGLLTDSVIMADDLATVRYSEIDGIIGTFPGISEIDETSRAALAPL